MNDDEMAARIWEIYGFDDLAAYTEGGVRHVRRRGQVNEFPQSGERFRGAGQPSRPCTRPTRATPERGPSRVCGGSSSLAKPGSSRARSTTATGSPVNSISIVETGPDGKIVKQTDYFANPFEAPEWRRPYQDK